MCNLTAIKITVTIQLSNKANDCYLNKLELMLDIKLQLKII